MLTLREASASLREQINEQVEISRLEKAEPNVAIRGDSRVKAEFWTLLDPQEQRSLFLSIAGNRHVWPRLRSLVGSPPYSFLRASDEGVLRAGGITKGRVRMAHAAPVSTGYAEFRPHFLDGLGRQFRIVDREDGHRGLLPFKGLSAGTKVVVDVRIKRIKRLVDFRGDVGEIRKAASMFPSVKDALILVPVIQIRHIHDEHLRCVTVRVLHTRVVRVARLLCVVS